MDLERTLAALRQVRVNGTGIRDWSLSAGQSRSVSVGIKDREVGNPHAPFSMSEACAASFKVIWEDGRVSRGHLERQQLESNPVEALNLAHAAAYEDADAAWVLGPAPLPDVAIHDTETAEMASGETALFARRLDTLRELVERNEIRTWSGSFSASVGQSRLLTSAGIDAGSESTRTGWHVTLNGEFGDGFGARRPEATAEFDRRLERLLLIIRELRTPATAVQPGLRPVLLHPGVVERYVLDTLLSNLGGSTVAHGDGHFRREQFGAAEPVLREDIGLRIDPLQPYKSGAYRFTSEGVPAAPCAFITRGRLVQPLLDLKYARRLGLSPTPAVSSSDTTVFDGSPPLSVDEALSRAGGGALILSVLGIHTQDSASGDFSLLSPQGLAIRDGGFAGRLRATISGNLFQLLTSDDLQFVHFEGEPTPGLLVSCRLDPQ